MEFMRFMRYVLPGLVVIAELTVAVFLASCFDSKFRDGVAGSFVVTWLSTQNNSEKLIGLAASTFLMSGGIGYIFSVIYHAFWNRVGRYYRHLPCLKYLVCNGFIVLKAADKCAAGGTQVIKAEELYKLSDRTIWQVFHAVWYIAQSRDAGLDHNDKVVKRQIDILHGQGAILAGSILSWMLFLTLVLRINDNSSSIWSVPLILWLGWLLFLIVLWWLYSRLKSVITVNLNNALSASFSNNKFGPVIIPFFNTRT